MTNRRAEFINMVDHLTDVPQKIVQKEAQLASPSPYRQYYHIEGESGAIGDPNGFSYFNGKYHLFHQWSPLAFSQSPHYTQHGWKHLISKDLVHWENLGAGMESDTPLDRYGTYSGSAIPVEDKLFLMYTGNTWVNTQSEDDWHRVPFQVGAMMDKDNQVVKWTKPLMKGPLPGYTGHFRDPKIFKKDDTYYAVLGIQRENLTGTALLVKSKDLKNWKIVGEIKPTANQSLGYMWECPDYYEIGDNGILEFCPQGLKEKDNHFRNIYQNGYFIGKKLNLDTGEFDCQNFQELDKGFDFYAMQTMQSPDDRRILMAWMGISDIEYPTTKFHYNGSLIFPREITVKNNHIYQSPIREIKNIYSTNYTGKVTVKHCEKVNAGNVNARDIKIDVDCSSADYLILDLFADQKNTSHLRLIFNQKKNEFIVDRSHCGVSFAEAYGNTRFCSLDLSKKVKVRILQDISSAEIFLNDGKEVFSLRLFSPSEDHNIFLTSHNGTSVVDYDIHELQKIM